MHHRIKKKRFFYFWENAPQARFWEKCAFFMKQNAPQARLIKPNAPQPDFLTES